MIDWEAVFSAIDVPVTWDEHVAASAPVAALITPPQVELDTRHYMTMRWDIYLIVTAATRQAATEQALELIRRLADSGAAPDRAEPVALTGGGVTYSAYRLVFSTD